MLTIQLNTPLQSSTTGATNPQKTEQDIAAWKENGFESSQRVLNLKKRMEGKSPQEIKKLEKTPGRL